MKCRGTRSLFASTSQIYEGFGNEIDMQKDTNRDGFGCERLEGRHEGALISIDGSQGVGFVVSIHLK